jgi:transposase
MSRLTGDRVIRMRQLYAQGYSAKECAERFGVAESTAQKVITGRTWRHLPGAMPLRPRRSG